MKLLVQTLIVCVASVGFVAFAACLLACVLCVLYVLVKASQTVQCIPGKEMSRL